MKTFAFRLKPEQDLRKEIERFVQAENISAGVLLSCVGSLSRAALRMAGAQEVKECDGPFEIVSCGGTLSQDGVHIHVALSDEEGNCVGGYLKDGCVISTTAEIVIGESDAYAFSRTHDTETGFDEFEITLR